MTILTTETQWVPVDNLGSSNLHSISVMTTNETYANIQRKNAKDKLFRQLKRKDKKDLNILYLFGYILQSNIHLFLL